MLSEADVNAKADIQPVIDLDRDRRHGFDVEQLDVRRMVIGDRRAKVLIVEVGRQRILFAPLSEESGRIGHPIQATKQCPLDPWPTRADICRISPPRAPG